MRRSAVVLLLPFVAAAPLAAQFEGTVTFKVPVAAPAVTTMTYYVKGQQLATVMTMSGGSGPTAGMEARMIYDMPNHKMTMLVTMPPSAGMGKGMKTVTDLDQAAAGSAGDKTDIKDLGTSETIAGYKCEDYEVTDNGKPSSRMCLTHDLGTFVYPPSAGGMRGRGTAAPSWAAVFGSKPIFPLKIWGVDGKVYMEATAVQKGPVPADTFTIPDGYMDMSGMMGRGRGGL